MRPRDNVPFALVPALAPLLALYALPAVAGKVQADESVAVLRPAVAGVARIVLLAPEVVFEDQRTGRTLDPAERGGAALSARLASTVRACLAERGFAVGDGAAVVRGGAAGPADVATVAPGGAAENAATVAGPRAALLVRKGPLSPAACAGAPAAPVFAVHARVTVGSGGSWNPMSGAITSASHHVRLRAALVDCATAEVRWRNEVDLRGLPEPESRALDEAIDALLGLNGSRSDDDRKPR